MYAFVQLAASQGCVINCFTVVTCVHIFLLEKAQISALCWTVAE